MNQYDNNGNNTPQNNGAGQNNSPPPPVGLGHQIGDTVRSALHTGDLSRLKDLGPAIQEAVEGIPGVNMHKAQQNRGQQQPPRQTYPRQTYPRQPAHRPQTAPRPQDRAAGGANQPSWYGKPGGLQPRTGQPGANQGVGSIVLGSMGVAGFGFLALSALVLPVPGVVAAVFALFAAGSGAGIGSGISKHRFAGRLKQYYARLEAKNVQTVDELAAATKQTQAEVKKDLKKGLKKGMIKYVYFDKDETTVMLGENNYHLYLQSEQIRAQKLREEAEMRARMDDDPMYAELEKFKAEGVATLRKIREANDAIPGDEISEKLDRLENTTGKIFACVEAHPEKLGETRRFMNYYLPTTLKLVDKYRQYEEMEAQPPSIIKARADIENTLDTIDTAFNNMLDNLYQEDTMDIATDIEVLQAMLEQEGLTGRRFQVDAESEPGSSLRF